MTSGAKAVTKPSGSASVTLAGDVTGPSGSNTVAKINGSALGTTTGATSGQYLAWNGSAWVPTTPASGGVTSFNTRTGAVVPATGDYLAVPTGGLTGAVAATRYVGGTSNGAPTAGTFAVGDFIVDATSSIWVCTTAGTPGTWATTISNHITLRSATATAKYNEITLFQGSTASQTISAPSSPIDSCTFTIINNSSVTVTAGFSANAMYPLGSASTVTSLSVPVNTAYSFVNYNGGNWYMVSSNNAANIQGTLPTTNGGTGLSTIGTAGQVLTVNSGATGLQYSTPSTGAPGTTVSAYMTTDIPNASGVPDLSLLSISLTAGTWLINYWATISTTASCLYDLYLSTVSTYSGGIAAISSQSANNYMSMSGSYIYTNASTQTIYLGIYLSNTTALNSSIRYQSQNTGILKATGLVASKMA